jgi:UDP-N-acetylglucosamine 2-epimerase (non-hydrolysing)
MGRHGGAGTPSRTHGACRLKILHVVGARPNFPKLAPVYREARAAGVEQLVVHTGQHYDDAMSASFFRDLGLREPEVNLNVGSGSHAAQTARIMERIEPVMLEAQPDWVVVYGDVNSTVAAALVAVKIGLRVAHVEAGVRSGDRAMPEEINRIVTDRLADLLLTPSRAADAQLRAEGEPANEIAFVGNVMVDTLLYAVQRARQTEFRRQVNGDGPPVVVTLHRPANVDDPQRLLALAAALREVAADRPVVFPVHPRTRARLHSEHIDMGRVRLLEPLGYLEMLDLVEGACLVVTDSGGLQVESAALGVRCLTVRPTTEWPETVECGANRLVPDPQALPAAVVAATASRVIDPPRPDGWDGMAAVRILDCLRSTV